MMRVEVARRKVRVDANQAYHAFAKRFLDKGLKAQLDQVRWAKKAAGNNKWGWTDIVTVCKDLHTGCALGHDSGQPAAAHPAANHNHGHSHQAAPPSNNAPRTSPPRAAGQLGGAGGARGPKHCTICAKLGGVGADTHNDEWCFCNKKSKVYKAEVHQRRVNQAEAKGITVPAELRPASSGGGGQNLIGALQGMVHEVAPDAEDPDQLIDQLLCYQQEQAGSMLGSITHVSDGDVPQHILALGPEGELQPSKMEELVNS